MSYANQCSTHFTSYINNLRFVSCHIQLPNTEYIKYIHETVCVIVQYVAEMSKISYDKSNALIH